MERKYGKVTRQTIEELSIIVGKDNIFTNKSEMEGYSYDEMPLTQRHAPQAVVKSPDARAIAKLLAFANEKRIPVTPRGAGTGLTGVYTYLRRHRALAGANEPGSGDRQGQFRGYRGSRGYLI